MELKSKKKNRKKNRKTEKAIVLEKSKHQEQQIRSTDVSLFKDNCVLRHSIISSAQAHR